MIGGFIKNSFIRRTAVIFGGSALGQLVLLAFTPFLARIYSTEAFGVFTVYSSVLMISSTVSTLRYEYAIALPEHDDDAHQLLMLNFLLSLFFSLLIALVIVCFYEKINQSFGLPSRSMAFFFLPLASFLNGCTAAMNYYLLRYHCYKSISTAGIVKNTTSIGLQSLLSDLNKGLGLIAGSILGLALSSASYCLAISKKKKRKLWKINRTEIYRLALEYKKIPIYTLTADLTANLSAQLPTMMIGSIFGIKTAAFYGIANRLVMTPLQMLGLSVGQVLYGEAASNLRADKRYYPLIKRTVLYLLLIGSIPITFAAIGATPLFDLVLGHKWHEAAIYARILAPWWLASFVSLPVIDLFSILGHQKYHLRFMAAQLILRASCLYIGAFLFHKLETSMTVFSFVSAALSFSMVAFLLKKAKDGDNGRRFEHTESVLDRS